MKKLIFGLRFIALFNLVAFVLSAVVFSITALAFGQISVFLLQVECFHAAAMITFYVGSAFLDIFTNISKHE